ncbi:hypothetical protein [Acinetobacter pittii]|jgi:hypothetical protein|uniref:hypothetical protein n=1 Tax=Acinetobacter pittii TaxID=48296 RepID=UPI000A354A78|nr:hypothetical protein [Acinetobacter pittii]OTM21480.1 hypothetical protein B9X52_03430 [Acinetobacter pittii]
MLTRTVNTLRNRTELIQSLELIPNRSIEVRRLSNRRKNSHYIIVYHDSMSSKKDWESVPVITEVSYINNILSFDVKPSKQYPELARYENGLEDKIRNIISISKECIA